MLPTFGNRHKLSDPKRDFLVAESSRIRLRDAVVWLTLIIGPDGPYLRLAIVYGVAISLLSLATPISVQLLISSVANTALPTPMFTLAAILFGLLSIVAFLSALRVYVMALFERRIFARIVAEITVRAVHAQNPFFADAHRSDLFNRFFDLTVVQKAVPSLLIGWFTILLQSAVGLIVTSFYHPFFFAFNLLLALTIFVVWQIWLRGSMRSAVALSHAKHATARWLGSLGASNGFYKSSRHLDFALERSERATAGYIDAHRRYFRHSFSQTVIFLMLYALASATLLALGGWLILQNQLSIGQLVAAELILSSVFYGVSQLGTYLDIFYEMVASSEELSLFYDIPQERNLTKKGAAPASGALRLRDVEFDEASFNFEIEAGQQLVTSVSEGADRNLSLLLKRNAIPARGIVMIGGADIAALDMYLLRSQVIVLDRPTIVQVTIREYLSLLNEEVSAEEIANVLDVVGLTPVIARLPGGMDTLLASSGAPLSIGELMALKLANAIVVGPRVLMMSSLCDLLPVDRLMAALVMLRRSNTTVLVCTGRPNDIKLDDYFELGRRRQRLGVSLADIMPSRDVAHG
jgi:putative ABC transport system ATP-binding protein